MSVRIRIIVSALCVFLIHSNSFAGKFDFVIYNRYLKFVKVSVTTRQGNKIKVTQIDVNPRSRVTHRSKLNSGDYVEFHASSSDGTIYKSVRRVYSELVTPNDNLIEGSHPTNINIIELFAEPSRVAKNFGELLLDITNDKYLKKVTDTSQVKINSKIQLGSFLIYEGNNLLEPFPATEFWKNGNNVQVFNTYSGFQVKRVIKNDSVGANASVPLIGKLSADFEGKAMVDYRWYIKNYREELWTPTDKNPQSIFKTYPEQTGYKYLKQLIADNDKHTDYKVFFVISVSITDSIKLAADNFSSVDKDLDMNFGLPPANAKVVKIGAGGEFYKSSRFYSEEDKGKIYNFFEVMDISQSTIYEILDELEEERRISEQEKIKKQETNLITRVENLELKLTSTYNSMKSLVPDVLPDATTTDILSVIQIPNLDAKIAPDSASSDQIATVSAYNMSIINFNTLRESFLTLQDEYVDAGKSLIDFKIVTENLIPFSFFEKRGPSSNRKLTDDELYGIIVYSKENLEGSEE